MACARHYSIIQLLNYSVIQLLNYSVIQLLYYYGIKSIGSIQGIGGTAECRESSRVVGSRQEGSGKSDENPQRIGQHRLPKKMLLDSSKVTIVADKNKKLPEEALLRGVFVRKPSHRGGASFAYIMTNAKNITTVTQ
jgi:hypothetical protein